jgi:putative endonuclease
MANPIQKLSRWIKSSGFVFWRRSDSSQGPDPDARHSLGAKGEKIAASFLKQLGYRILAQGHRKKLGEIDIIAVDAQCVVFVEVKTWRSDEVIDPSAAVTTSKQDKITRTALAYLKKNNLLSQPARFDVVTIVWPDQGTEPKIRHYKHAFEAIGNGQLFR